MKRRAALLSRLVAGLLLIDASIAVAQQPANRGSISGSVVDASSAAPLAYATVTLTAADGFGVLLDTRASSPIALSRTVTTTSTGDYRFSDLPIGVYRLRVQRVGYEPVSLDVRLGDTGTSPVSVGLVVLPVRLRPVEVHARDSHAAPADRSTAVAEDPRLAAVRARQAAFLATDTRELTSRDVAESATLGGSDVLRAVQRLPGVTPFDDWSAKFWIRGNRWDHNRVYFDGVPLFDPLGVLGRTSGVSAMAIGGAFLHPGVRPVSLGGEGATRIDLRSRPASPGDWGGAAELSQFGANMALERGRADARAGALLTAQQSLGQWLPRRGFFEEALGGRSYRDTQATLRGDVDLGGSRRVEVSGLFTRDARLYALSADSDGTNQEWRNAVGRVTLYAPIGTLASAHTIAASSFASSSDRWIAEPSNVPALPPIVTASPATAHVDYFTLSGRFAPRADARNATSFGYDLIAQRSSINGTQASVFWGNPAHALASRSTALDYASLWAQRRTVVTERLTVENGLRFDVGGAHGVDAVRPAGSTQALIALSADTRLSVGASRVHQYTQALALPLVAQGQASPAAWLTSGDDVPVMTVDNAMAGVEEWVTPSVLVAANGFVRHTAGVVSDDPTPGSLLQRPLFVTATEWAHGVELSARKLIGRATGLIGYSYGHATTRARGLSFPAPADRTHALDAAASLHLGAFNLGSAYVLTTGAPYTRMLLGASLATTNPTLVRSSVREAPNARRLPAYSSLDVAIDYTRVMGRARLIAFAGAQNVLGRANATWYEVSGFCDDGHSQPKPSPQCVDRDLFQSPVKLAPTLGLRLVVR